MFCRPMQTVILPPVLTPLLLPADVDQDRRAGIANALFLDQTQDFEQPGCLGFLQRVAEILFEGPEPTQCNISSQDKEEGKRDQCDPGQALEPVVDPVHTIASPVGQADAPAAITMMAPLHGSTATDPWA